MNIADLMKSNMTQLNDLYKYFCDLPGLNPANNRPYTDLNLQLCLAIGYHMELTDTQIAEAYSYAKMMREDEEKSEREYKKLKLVEF